MVAATFRFYAGLNDFLPPERRGRDIDVPCARAATLKHMVEALGVPHTEVELVLVNGEPCGFGRLLADGDRVAAYPKFEALDVATLPRLRERPPGEPRFAADVHLGGLTRFLRMAGFDAFHASRIDDAELVALALREGRTVLTRDRELLKRRDLTHGCYVHAIRPEGQFAELVDRLDLARAARPFSRCLACNRLLRAVEKTEVLARLPPRVAERQERFSVCDGCGGVFWEGSHWRRMRELLDRVLAGAGRSA